MNTDYRNTKVDLRDLKEWKNFPTVNDIYLFSKSTTLLEANFHKAELPVIAGDKRWYDRWFDGSPMSSCLAEINVVEMLSGFFLQLNALIRLASYEKGKKSSWVMVGSGKAAKERRRGGTPEKKDPDRVAFWTDGECARTSEDDYGPSQDSKNIPCLLVGDYKMTGKFNEEMLKKALKGKNLAEPQKVLNQIHDYMDMHHNRFGYIITEKEIVMFRRRDHQERWAQVDFSPAIPIHAPEGKINALMVLWYFHVKYAVMNEGDGYRLHSFYHNCPEILGGGRYPELELAEPIATSSSNDQQVPTETIAEEDIAAEKPRRRNRRGLQYI